jgi:ketosteroid isomerase-like protein
MVENLSRQRVLNFLDVFYSGDLEGALARCSDDIVLIAPAPIDVLPHMGRRHGKDEVRKTWQTVHARHSSMRHEIREIVAEADKVAVNIRAFFKKRSNGRTVQFDIAVFFTLRDGRIREIREIMDTFDLVQQVLERDLLTGKGVDEG